MGETSGLRPQAQSPQLHGPEKYALTLTLVSLVFMIAALYTQHLNAPSREKQMALALSLCFYQMGLIS